MRGCHEQHRAGGVTTAEVGRELSDASAVAVPKTTPTSFFTVTVEPAGALPVTVDRDAWRFVGAVITVTGRARDVCCRRRLRWRTGWFRWSEWGRWARRTCRWHQLLPVPIVFHDGSLIVMVEPAAAEPVTLLPPENKTSRPVHERHAGGCGGESSLRGCHEQHRAGGVTTAEVGRELSGRICCCRAENNPTSFFTVTVEPAGALPSLSTGTPGRFVGAVITVTGRARDVLPATVAVADRMVPLV